MTDTTLTTAARELHELSAALTRHKTDAQAEERRLVEEIRQRQAILSLAASGIDHDKVALAKTIIVVRGSYAKGGTDRASVVVDAVRQLVTGEPIRLYYGDLWKVAFGTKSYDRWDGQRSDHEYGCGPRHGSTIFSVGLMPEVRKMAPTDLTPDQIEAAVYYLTNLERIQTAEAEAKAKAEAA